MKMYSLSFLKHIIKYKRSLVLLTGCFVFTFLAFSNCTGKKSDDAAVSGDSLFKLSSAPYSLDGNNLEIQNYKLQTSDGPVYFQVIPGCADKCPVVVASMPYNGTSWTNDENDLRWTTNFPTGAFTDDVDGPDYIPSSGEKIAFYNASLADTAGFGGIFVPSNVTAVIVYNRFYLGRKINSYVNDFVSVVNSLSQFAFIDTSKMGFIGASLGGFVAMHASRKTIIKPVAVVGLTPLLDLKSEYTHMSTPAARITSNPTLLQSTQSFYNSYVRRMSSINLDDYTSASLAAENSSSAMLIIHDTWDTIVPISQYDLFSTQRSVDSFIFQHSGAVDYNNFTMGHSQSGEGYTNEKIYPVFMSYLLKRLLSDNDEKIIYYSSPDFFTAVNEVKLAQGRSQNISWFKTFIQDLCTENFLLKDFSTISNMGTLTGKQMAGGLIVNTWGQPTTIDAGCDYLVSHPTLFD